MPTSKIQDPPSVLDLFPEQDVLTEEELEKLFGGVQNVMPVQPPGEEGGTPGLAETAGR